MARQRPILDRVIDRATVPTETTKTDAVDDGATDGAMNREPTIATAPPPLPTGRPKLAIVARNTSSELANAKQAAESRAKKTESRAPAERSRGHDISTGVIIPGLPLPPPTDLEQPQFRLRRDESVIAQAVLSRKPLDRVQEVARRASADAAGALSNIGAAAAEYVGQGSLQAVKRFQALPRKKQILWVAAPYAIVLLLVLVLIQLRDPARGAPSIVPTGRSEPAQAAIAPEGLLPPASAAPRPHAPAKTEPTPLAKIALASGPQPSPLSKLIEKSEHLTAASDSGFGQGLDRLTDSGRSARGLWRTIPIASSLRVKPDGNALRVARLRSKSRLIVFPDFPARDGWILAQRTSGEVGFIPRLHLDGKRDPRFDKDEPKRVRTTRAPRAERINASRRSRSPNGPRI